MSKKPLAIILALVLVGMIIPVFAAPPQPSPYDPNYSISFSMSNPAQNTMTLPNPVPVSGTPLTFYIWLNNATLATIDTAQAPLVGVGGVEVHVTFDALVPYLNNNTSTFTSYVTGNVGIGQNIGVFNNSAPAGILVGIPAGFYGDGNVFEYAASGAVAWYSTVTYGGSTSGLIASVTLNVTSQPGLLQPDFVGAIGFTSDQLTNIVDFATASNVNFAIEPASATIPHAIPAAYNYPTTEPFIYLDTYPMSGYTASPVFDESSMANNSMFNVTVAIGNNQHTNAGVDPKWDVAGFDVGVTWNNTLINYVGGFEGGFLSSGGCATVGLNGGSFSFGFANSVVGDMGMAEAVFTKTTDPTPAQGIDSLAVFEFQIIYAPPAGIVTTGLIDLERNNTEGFYQPDLATWAHPEILSAPWNGSLTAMDMGPPNAGPLSWTANGGSPIPPGFFGVGVEATYYAPYTTPFVAGGYIDLYDQYPAPYGGQGWGQHSDSFGLQQLVVLHAKVTYNGGLLVNKLVVFQINDASGQKYTVLQNYTDHNGISTVSFRVPNQIGANYSSCGQDPQVFGWWVANATVDIDQNMTYDYMWFQVGYLVQVLRVDINNLLDVGGTMNTAAHQAVNFTSTLNTAVGEQTMDFTALVLTIHEQPLQATFSVDTYDCEGYPLTENTWTFMVNATRIGGVPGNTTGGVYEFGTPFYFGPLPSTILPLYFHEDPAGTTPVISAPGSITALLPYWARLSPFSMSNQYGYASVIGYALTALPMNSGVPYGPQSNANDQYLPSNPVALGDASGTPFYINGPG